jgi:dihydrofolate synthase / folylpolyglutamate synthase
LKLQDHHWSITERGDGLLFEGEREQWKLPLPGLPGRHQYDNAGLALAALEQTGLPIPAFAARSGLRRVEWPARAQKLTRGALVAALPPGWELWLDGGHNPAAGTVLGDAVVGWCDHPLYLIVGMLNTKDAGGFLAPLAPHAGGLQAVTIPGEENPHPAAQIAAAARALGIPAQESVSVEAALRAIIAGHKEGPVRVLICGSLHFAGVVLADNR